MAPGPGPPVHCQGTTGRHSRHAPDPSRSPAGHPQAGRQGAMGRCDRHTVAHCALRRATSLDAPVQSVARTAAAGLSESSGLGRQAARPLCTAAMPLVLCVGWLPCMREIGRAGPPPPPPPPRAPAQGRLAAWMTSCLSRRPRPAQANDAANPPGKAGKGKLGPASSDHRRAHRLPRLAMGGSAPCPTLQSNTLRGRIA
jgi:hypothetical protein